MRLLIPALVLTLVLNLLGILQPKFTQYAIDWYILPRITNGLNLFVLAFFGVQVFRFVASYFQTVLLNTVGQYVMFDLRNEIYDKLQHQEVAYYDRNPAGRIMTRLTADVDALNELFTSGVTDRARRSRDDCGDHRRDGLHGLASDAGDAADRADAVRGDDVVSQRRAPRL